MTATVRKSSSKRARARHRPRWWLISAVLLGGALAVTGAAWLIRHRVVSGPHAAKEIEAIEPPVVELAGIDPAVTRAIEKARAAVNQAPRSVEAWGRLGKTLLAHDFHVPASVCLAQAERLDPTTS